MKRINTVSYPYEISEENGSTVLRFFPKTPGAKTSNAKLKFELSPKDKQTLIEQLRKSV
jgi:hypothetical protein